MSKNNKKPVATTEKVMTQKEEVKVVVATEPVAAKPKKKYYRKPKKVVVAVEPVVVKPVKKASWYQRFLNWLNA